MRGCGVDGGRHPIRDRPAGAEVVAKIRISGLFFSVPHVTIRDVPPTDTKIVGGG